MVQKQRNSKKKATPIELPQSILNQYSRIGNVLRNSLSRKWMRYEFQYDEIEDAFFNKNGTFEAMLSIKFPQLKTTGLIMVEWRKIRSLIVAKKQRRFSTQFVRQQRIDLEKYRRVYNLLVENGRHDQLMKLKAPFESVPLNELIAHDASPQIEIFRLIIEVKKLLAVKSGIVAELREINSLKDKSHSEEEETSRINAIDTVIKLRKCNDEIMNCFSKLVRFQLVKDALMFDAMDKKRLFLAMSPVYFQRKFELRIYDDHCEYQSNKFIFSVCVRQLFDALIELAHTIIEYEKLATNALHYAKHIAQQHSDTLKHMMAPNVFKYFDEIVMPFYFITFTKVCA